VSALSSTELLSLQALGDNGADVYGYIEAQCYRTLEDLGLVATGAPTSTDPVTSRRAYFSCTLTAAGRRALSEHSSRTMRQAAQKGSAA
jgi:hypothetical protein